VPVLTMPAGDLTHPVPDLTGYITEGQVVLSAERHARGVYPPIDPLSSLSRLMRLGAGPGRTRDDHRELAAQALSLLARARDVTELADLLGADALSDTERRYLAYADAFDTHLAQRPDEDRTSTTPSTEPGKRCPCCPGASWPCSPPTSSTDGIGVAPGRSPRRAPPTPRRSPMPGRAPPGRAGRVRLAERVGVARRAVDLLEQKQQLLRREQRRLAELADRTGRHWRALAAVADTWNARALVAGGCDELRRAASIAGTAEARLGWTGEAGVTYASTASTDLPPFPALAGTAALTQAADACDERSTPLSTTRPPLPRSAESKLSWSPRCAACAPSVTAGSRNWKLNSTSSTCASKSRHELTEATRDAFRRRPGPPHRPTLWTFT
jgi:ATP synthase alpha/beta family, nucleotide-binding domain